MVMKIQVQKAKLPVFTEEEQLLQKAVILLQKFINLTEYGVLQGCDANRGAKEFLNEYKNYLL